MNSKEILADWVVEALAELGGSGSVVDVSKSIWEAHQSDLVASGDLFYTWQYDMRWAAQKLRDSGVLSKLDGDRRGQWAIANSADTSKRSLPWTADEIAATVDSYFRMLRHEIAGEEYRKVDENRRVVRETGRERTAVEFKYANISAVLEELGMRYVIGYKPRTNVQEALREAVDAKLQDEPI